MGEYGINTAACATVTAPSKWYTRDKFTKKEKEMPSSVFRDIIPCHSLYANQHFGATYGLCLHI
jgi:hypothetical protein